MFDKLQFVDGNLRSRLEVRSVFRKGQHMQNENGFKKAGVVVPNPMRLTDRDLHPAWSSFISYCAELQHGDIETLKIQDGVPVLAEITRKKVKFAL